MKEIAGKIDHTQLGLKKVDGRLDKLVSEMSFCRMWTVVCIEVFILILIICM